MERAPLRNPQRRIYLKPVIGQRGVAALNVAVNGTPMLPTGMYTTVWFGEFTISFCASMASCWMYMSLS